ncbi:MAG: serine/threonine-protein kinase [Betaproteobacteria bacterium]|nr:serine/threonine protein kinase [Burkholderiaceae bacterium]MCZ8109556.1 serine/threonine-protein kinase [Rubrivivax sp.]MCZ8175980.1 serine/threonine-protein kinase [Burkholderiaceae bacterium]
MTDLDPTEPPRREPAPDAAPGALERAEQKTLLMPRRERDAHLPAGTLLQEYRLERVLGVGGYSIVYLAHDTRLDRRVAIKEFLPATLAARAPSGEVVPRLPRFEDAFAKGMGSFINEARLLGGFDHPALVKVYRFCQANGTAYMVMPYYEGMTLRQWLADLGAPPSERWLRQLASPLLEALQVLHEHGIVHRDVAPDNVVLLVDRDARSYLEQAPRPVLLDFGAARRVAAEATQQLTAILKTGYSPVEQYDQGHALKAGPWSDIYSLAAVLYAAAVGKPPVPAIARVLRDELTPAKVAARGRCSPGFLSAIDAGLAVQPERRPQTVAEFREWLERPDAAEPDIALPADEEAGAIDLALEPAVPSPPAAPISAPAAPAPRRLPWIAGGIVAVLALGLLAWGLLGPR